MLICFQALYLTRAGHVKYVAVIAENLRFPEKGVLHYLHIAQNIALPFRKFAPCARIVEQQNGVSITSNLNTFYEIFETF